jgi:hypothetical protein
VLLHLERFVHAREHCRRVAEIQIGQGLGTQRLERGDREQRRADAVAADVEQVEGEVVVVDPVVPEGIAAELCRGHVAPLGERRPGLDRFGQQRDDVIGRARQLRSQLLLALEQLGVGFVALEQVDVAPRMVADARHQLDAIGQLD